MFPLYRRYITGTSYFKIISQQHMQEIQKAGSRWFLFDVEAHQYPERVRIAEITAMDAGLYVEISESEYNAVYQQVQSSAD
jgi:hypothetical protein